MGRNMPKKEGILQRIPLWAETCPGKREICMAKNLVIVESPAKVKTIKKFLGKNYEVTASNGHVRDLNSIAIPFFINMFPFVITKS